MYKLKSLYCINFFLNIFQQYKFQMKKPVPKIYRTMNWSTNNRALINRGNISIGLILQLNGSSSQRQTWSKLNLFEHIHPMLFNDQILISSNVDQKVKSNFPILLTYYY
jgi:hypothetical protein